MRILIASLRGPTAQGRRGGAQEYVRARAAPWVREGHAVTVLCASERFPDGTLAPDRETVDGLEVVRVGTPSKRLLPLARAIREQAASVDAVVENIMAVPLALPWRLPRGTPLVAVKHHLQGATFVRSQGWVRGTVGRVLESGLFPIAYRDTPLVVPSLRTASRVRRLRPGWRAVIHVLPPPVAPLALPAVDRAERPTVLYVGALHLARKRVDDLLAAFREVVRRVPEAELIVAGDGPDRAEIERLASGLPVTFTGFVTEAEKARLFATAWAFASPSLEEGFGITWVEAGAAGLPVVAYRVDGLDTLTDACAIQVAPGDIDSLADGLVRVLTDAPLRQRLSDGGRANATRFDLEKTSQAFLGIIEQEIARRRGGLRLGAEAP